ncbi:tRNA-intron lyase [Plasmodiophora brassicae]|nr:hypothetical protein PBRA_008497 [Plasmodiophora brassicae]
MATPSLRSRAKRGAPLVYDHVEAPPGRRDGRAYRAVLQRRMVVVDDLDDAVDLYRGGFFGKGSLSRSAPTRFEDGERLVLLHVEALYLSSQSGLHCLEILDAESGAVLTDDALWDRFCRVSPQFPAQYAAYRHLRKLGWVPKSGLKFGVDFVVYMKGPSFYHARFSVVVVNEAALLSNPRGSSWTNLHMLMRTTHNVAKDILFVHVRFECADACAMPLPAWLESVQLASRIATRWIPERSRESAPQGNADRLQTLR